MKKPRLLSLVLLFLLMECSTVNTQVADFDGNSYSIKDYNGKVWMTENLRAMKDRDGKIVPFFFPDNKEALTEEYGLLYDYQTACKVCPQGWRLPTETEWNNLLLNYSVSDVKDLTYWDGSTNKSGFSIRPAGYGNNEEFDNFFNRKAIMWSGTKPNEHDVLTFVFESDADSVRSAPQHPTYGFSVRCIKNE